MSSSKDSDFSRAVIACLGLTAGGAVAFVALKVGLMAAGLDAILNVASNCGAEAGAGGLGAGAGSMACGDEDSDEGGSANSGAPGAGSLADNSLSDMNTRLPRSAYDDAVRYSNSMQQRVNQSRRDQNSGSSTQAGGSQGSTNTSSQQPSDSTSTDSIRQTPIEPDAVKFPDERQEQA